MKRLTVSRICQVCVAIDQPRQYGHFGEINQCGTSRNRQVFADGLDLSAFYQNHLIRKHSTGVHVHEFSRAN